MDNESKRGLEQDEELSALRLAALATLKQRSIQSDNASFAPNSPLQNHAVKSCDKDDSATNHIPFIQSDRSNHSQSIGNSWRKNNNINQSARRRPGVFPKSSQRSNLIVINPVSPNEKEYSKRTVSGLALPQHKWYNSGNEDSMSPKSFRRTGPTRFNRHESDSDDSDSELEKSDDSDSNETVLQDEPSEKFSKLAPEANRFEDTVEKRRISERRTSFPALDSERNHDIYSEKKTTSVYNSLKPHSFENPDSRAGLRATQFQNDSEQTWRSNNENSCEDHNKFDIKSPMSEKFQLNSKVEIHSNFRIAESNYEQQYVKNHETSKLNVWNYNEINKNDLYSKDELYNSNKNLEFQNVEAKRHSLASTDLRTELKNSRHTNSRKNSCESWVSVNVELDGHDLKHSRNMDQNWQNSVNRKNCLNDEYLNKDYTHNSKKQDQTLLTDDNFQNDGLTHKKKELHAGSICSQRKYSKSPDYWRKNRQRKGSQSSDSSHRGGSRSPQKCNQRERTPSADFHHKKRRQSTDHSHNHSDPSYRYKHRNRNSESPLGYRSRSPEHTQRKCKDNSDYRQWKSSESSESNKTKHNQASGIAGRRNSSKRDHRTSDDSDSSSSSTGRSWRKHRRSDERKRRERSWSNEANQRVNHSIEELSSAKQLQSEASKHFVDGKWQGDNLDSSDVLLKNKNEKLENLENKLNYKDINHKSQLHEDNFNCASASSAKKFDLSPQPKSSGSKLYDDVNVEPNSQTQVKGAGKKATEKRHQEQHRNTEIKHGKYDRNRSNSPQHKNLTNKNIYSSNHKYASKRNSSRSRSRSSSYSSSSSSNSSGSSPAIRSVSSVIKPIRLENIKTETKHDLKHVNKKSHTLESGLSSPIQKRLNSDERFSASSDKISVNNENRNHVAENTKRVPVHMRLGAFPRKRVIQMNKDVEAAFVNTSSDDETDVNTKCKKQNLRIVTEMYDSKTKGSCIIERKVEQDSILSRERSRNLKITHR